MIAVDMATKSRQAVIDQVLVTGVMTVTSEGAVALKAGSSELSKRSYLKVRNTSDHIPARVGATGISWKSGQLLDPGECCEFSFDKTVAVSIYGCSTGIDIQLEITEA